MLEPSVKKTGTVDLGIQLLKNCGCHRRAGQYSDGFGEKDAFGVKIAIKNSLGGNIPHLQIFQ